jgi:protein-tyrosine phosphatase
MSGEIHDLLVVCSANQCRSPMGAAMLAHVFAARGIEAQVASAGVQAKAGSAATTNTVRAASVYGLDLEGHRAQATSRAVVARADLILGMERMHVREVVVLDPRAFPRAFTLKELVRRGDAVGPRRLRQTQAAWLADVHRHRRSNELLGASPDDDVADPTSDLSVDHDQMAAEMADLVKRLVALLWPRGVD